MNRPDATWLASARARWLVIVLGSFSVLVTAIAGCAVPTPERVAAHDAAATRAPIANPTSPVRPPPAQSPMPSQRRSPAADQRRPPVTGPRGSAAPIQNPALAPGLATSGIPAPSGSGAYAGSPEALAAFSHWRGRPADFSLVYLSQRSWSLLQSPAWTLRRWRAAHTPLVISIPMLINSSSTTLQAGARGAYDSHFRTLARTLVANGYRNASLRVGWEMNGHWYRWSAFRDPGAWVTYYRRIVTVMRSVSGQSFNFDWNFGLGSKDVPTASIYPGNAYVDCIGVDAYDWRWGHPGISPAARWTWLVTEPQGLNWVASFAAAHGKRIAIPEWALVPRSVARGGGGGDDPHYIAAMLTWIRTHHVAYASYFDRGPSTLTSGAYPSGAAAYVAALRS